MATAVDYSYARPGGQTIAAAGYTAVLRYLGFDGRCITANERDDLHSAGLGIGLIWETSASRTLGGRVAGVVDAREANSWADRLGAPDWVPIFGVVVDFNANTDQLAGPISDYARGFAATSKRPAGAYGNDRAIDTLVGGGLVRYGWQCAAWSLGGSGSGGTIQSGYTAPARLSVHAHLFQHYGLDVIRPPGSTDHSEILKPAPLFWRAGQSAPEGDDDVTPEDIDLIAETVAQRLTNEDGKGPAANLTQIRNDVSGIAEHVIYLLVNPDGGADPTYHLEDGTPINLTAVLQAVNSVPAALEGLRQIVEKIEGGDAPSAAELAKALIDQLATKLAQPSKDAA